MLRQSVAYKAASYTTHVEPVYKIYMGVAPLVQSNIQVLESAFYSTRTPGCVKTLQKKFRTVQTTEQRAK